MRAVITGCRVKDLLPKSQEISVVFLTLLLSSCVTLDTGFILWASVFSDEEFGTRESLTFYMSMMTKCSTTQTKEL